MRGIWVLGVLLALAGCERPSSSIRYELLSGVLSEIDDRTGELVLQVGAPDDRVAVHCTVTADTEITINDQSNPVSLLRAGDRLDLIGYRQRGGGLDGYVATAIFVEREEPPAAPPAFLAWPGTDPRRE